MTATKNDISRWFDEGVAQGMAHMIVVCDTFDWEDYPVYTSIEDFSKTYKKYDGKDMQKIMEVYDLSMSKEEQLNQDRVKNIPRWF